MATDAPASTPAAGRRVLVDANVLLDVLTDDPDWYEWSAAQLDACADGAELCINPIIYAEVSVGFERIEELDAALPDLIILGNFPDGSAIDICGRLSRDPRLADIPVLMLVRPEQRLAALQAGATATLEPDVDDQMLMARIRNILRQSDAPQASRMGMAEAPAGFVHADRPLIVLIADSQTRARRWRQMLSERMPCRFEIRDPDEALGAASAGRTADLYLISADIRERGDGLRLLSELRSRQGSRDAGFVIAIGPDRAELSAIASKLGRIPTVAEYHAEMGIINKDAASVYRYMNFDQIEEYATVAKEVAV